MGGLGNSALYEQFGRCIKKLIAAVVDCVEYDEPPPIELKIAWDCKAWDTLPEAGGYFQQDYYLLKCMSVCVSVYDVLSKMRNLHGSKIHQLTEADRRKLRVLKDMGLIFNPDRKR